MPEADQQGHTNRFIINSSNPIERLAQANRIGQMIAVELPNRPPWWRFWRRGAWREECIELLQEKFEAVYAAFQAVSGNFDQVRQQVIQNHQFFNGKIEEVLLGQKLLADQMQALQIKSGKPDITIN